MKRRLALLLVVAVVCCLCGSSVLSAADSPPSRHGREYQRGHATVKAAFRESVAKASASTVRIRLDDEPVALGAIVDRDGYIITKADLLGDGELTCQLQDGREIAAKLVGRDDRHDLALLKIEAENLKPVTWRPGDPPAAGSWLATVDHGKDPLAIGVVGGEPGPAGETRRRRHGGGVLGIGLDSPDSLPRIATVAKGSAAQKAGLKVGDLIKRIDRKPMKSISQVVKLVRSHPVGKKVTVVVERDEKELELPATLQKPSPRSGGHSPEDHWGGGPFSQRRYGFPRVIPHDTVLHPNKCGGPVVDVDGNVVGINIARALRVMSYATPADVVQQVVKQLKAQQRQ